MQYNILYDLFFFSFFTYSNIVGFNKVNFNNLQRLCAVYLYINLLVIEDINFQHNIMPHREPLMMDEVVRVPDFFYIFY